MLLRPGRTRDPVPLPVLHALRHSTIWGPAGPNGQRLSTTFRFRPRPSDQAGYRFPRPYRPKRKAGPSTGPRTAGGRRSSPTEFASCKAPRARVTGDSQHIRPNRCSRPSVAGEERSLFRNSLFQDRCPSLGRRELRSRNGARRAKKGRSARPIHSSVATPKDRRRAATQSADKFNRAAASSRTACIRISSTAFLGRI